MIDIPARIQRETDYYSEEEIKDAIIMLFHSNHQFNHCLAQELEAIDIQHQVMAMLKSASFQQQWTENKLLKCQTQYG